MALPQPERSDLDSTVGGIAPIPSIAAAHPAGAPPGAVWLTMCAWCGRLKAGDRWIDAPASAHGAGSRTGERSLSHGICPSCFDETTAAAERYRLLRDE